MKSDVTKIYSDLKGREEAMANAEKFAQYNEITGRNARHIRLLTEELVSMVHGIMDGLEADLWFESEKKDGGILCRICLSSSKSVDPAQEEHLLSVASSGRNESAKGILGKIREAFRISAQYRNDGVYMTEYAALNSWYAMGGGSKDTANRYAKERMWSLMSYKESLSSDKESSEEEWDELEKSIIGKLADDVKVWLKADTTEVVVEKTVKIQ